ncbi:MGDG synthase family glycosyltransferase [Paenibacillus sp. N3.4]|uniref:MGDG synthase family glycosyltransferase n=1 Tax=Paenibacillus sp. N3.4 TaxID=2603222 RepID=UPI0011C72CD7|nr:glycosyltransferase [Paenibacillus sp. N3.4]TXK76969.1 glycosyltransferase [Paenibacillus sp. N3.4]
MNLNPRVLILTASYGNGHIKASQALHQQLIKQGVEQVKIVDLMKEGHPFIHMVTNSLINRSIQISRVGLNYYGWSYYLTRENKRSALLQRSMTILGKKKLKEIINQERPDAVVTTFPFGASPEICQSLGISNFTVLTDFALHSSWLHPSVDKYYVATEELKQQIISKGFTRDRIEVTGIPIRNEFTRNKSALGGSKKKILIMASDYGASRYVDDLLVSLVGHAHYHITVVCGRNEKLKQKLETQFMAYRNLTIHGYVNNLHDFMSDSSCIVTKAGGLTLTEAIAMQLPIHIYKPYAGQERENAKYLASRGVAAVSDSVEDLSRSIKWLLEHPTLREEVSDRMMSLSKNQAATHIVDDIIQTIRQPLSLSI